MAAIVHGGDLFGAAEALGRDWRELLDFSASINPLGPAPGVRRAVCDAFDRVVHYPRPHAPALVACLAAQWKIPPQRILAGNGATELLHFLARVTAASNATLAVPAFGEFHRAYPRARIVSAVSAESWPDDGWLILTNPLNPCGTLLDRGAIVRHLQRSTQPVVIDESFLDFTGEPSLAPLAAERDQLYILKSLTKFHALPGARVGALIASEATLSQLLPYREPWQVNVWAEAAAIASIQDEDFAVQTRRFVDREREWLRSRLAGIPGTAVFPSCTNYLAVKVEGSASTLSANLRRHGILVRDCSRWTGVAGEVVRVAVRSRAENERLVAAWREAVCER